MEKIDKKIVLAIDDDSLQLSVFKGILTPKYELWTVTSASEAMHYIHNYKADVILLDIKMPNVSGFEFLEDIHKIPSYINTPIIVISGFEGSEFPSGYEESTAFAVMSKPVDPKALVENIEEALAKSK